MSIFSSRAFLNKNQHFPLLASEPCRLPACYTDSYCSDSKYVHLEKCYIFLFTVFVFKTCFCRTVFWNVCSWCYRPCKLECISQCNYMFACVQHCLEHPLRHCHSIHRLVLAKFPHLLQLSHGMSSTHLVRLTVQVQKKQKLLTELATK